MRLTKSDTKTLHMGLLDEQSLQSSSESQSSESTSEESDEEGLMYVPGSLRVNEEKQYENQDREKRNRLKEQNQSAMHRIRKEGNRAKDSGAEDQDPKVPAGKYDNTMNIYLSSISNLTYIPSEFCVYIKN